MKAGAAFCKPASLDRLDVAAVSEGTTSTHEVDVRVVMPPLCRVVVHVIRTALDVDTLPVVMVLRFDCVGVGESDSSAAEEDVTSGVEDDVVRDIKVVCRSCSVVETLVLTGSVSRDDGAKVEADVVSDEA